jgi:predicted nucleic acid-binding protein
VNVYVDSSVLLRIVLGEARPLREWRKVKHAVSSELIRVECLRTIDRARIHLHLDPEEVAERRSSVLERLEAFELVRMGPAVVERAAEPFPTLIGTLDAVHLASALSIRHRYPDIVLATHDRDLAIAARAEGFRVLGVDRR